MRKGKRQRVEREEELESGERERVKDKRPRVGHSQRRRQTNQ